MDVRTLVQTDGSELLSLMRQLDQETKYMLYEPGERKITADEISEKIKETLESGSIILGAFDGNQLVGYISADRGFARRIEHSAYIVVGVLSNYAGRGIGRALVAAIDQWANTAGIIRLELTVMIHNEHALKLYESMGYVREGIKKGSLIVDGELVDEYYMGKVIERGKNGSN